MGEVIYLSERREWCSQPEPKSAPEILLVEEPLEARLWHEYFQLPGDKRAERRAELAAHIAEYRRDLAGLRAQRRGVLCELSQLRAIISTVRAQPVVKVKTYRRLLDRIKERQEELVVSRELRKEIMTAIDVQDEELAILNFFAQPSPAASAPTQPELAEVMRDADELQADYDLYLAQLESITVVINRLRTQRVFAAKSGADVAYLGHLIAAHQTEADMTEDAMTALGERLDMLIAIEHRLRRRG